MAYETPIDELDPYVPETDGTTGIWTIVKKSTWTVPKKTPYAEGSSSESLPTSVILGSESLPSTGWTSTGWTGTLAAGFTHTAGNVSVLSNTIAAIIDNIYQIVLTVTGRTAGTFTVSFGGETSIALSATDTFSTKATTNANFQITPTTDFNGTIVVSIKQITWELTAQEILDILGKVSIYSQTEVTALLTAKVSTESGKSLVLDSEITRLSSVKGNPYQINLPAGNLATKIAGATFAPAAWATIAINGSANAMITHTLNGRKISFVNVFEIDGADESLLSFDRGTAYTGIKGNGLTVLISGITATLPVRIELIFD